MDDLRTIIHTLDDEDRKEFRYFLNRIRQKGKRKDVALFNILQEEKEYNSKEIRNKLYTSEGVEAYYALRKRLNKQLTEFVILKSRERDTTAVASILELINVSQYLYDNKKDRLAFKYLNRAKTLAEEIEHFELLNGIYNLIIDKNTWDNEHELNEAIKRHASNKKELDLYERINFTNSIIKQKLIEHQKESISIDFNRITSKVFAKFDLNENILSSPRVLHKLMSMSRSTFLAKKDFHAFEPFIIEKYNELIKREAFTDRTVYYQIGLLYYIAHALYRNKKFEEVKKYLNEISEFLEGSGKSYYTFYYPRYMLLQAGTMVFTRNLNRAHECLDELLANKKIELEVSDRLNIQVNKGIYHYLEGDFDLTNNTLQSIYHTDKYCEKILGKEWVLKKNMMEMMLYFDMEKTDLAESRMRSIERNYKDLFRQSMYKRVKGFLSLIKYVIFNPQEVKSDHFYNMVQESIDWQPFAQEDLQAMGFYAWLKSKMQGRNYYETWLELAEKKD